AAASQHSYSMFDPTAQMAGISYAFRRARDVGHNGTGWIINSEVDPLVGCELGLRLSQSVRGLRAGWTYDTKKLTAAVVESINGCFVSLIREVLHKPGVPIANLQLIDAGDEVVLRGPVVAAPDTTLIGAIFDARREREIALTSNGQRVTYADLEAWSGRLAQLLVERYGVAEGDVVALMMGRSIEWVVAALSCMRLGACYAPVEVEAPPQRIRSIVERMAPKLLIAADAVNDTPVPTLQLDAACWQKPVAEPAAAVRLPAVGAKPDRPAYLLHTSGSGGSPKGVLVSEGSLLNYISWAAEHYGIRQIDASILHTSLAVDLTVTSLW